MVFWYDRNDEKKNLVPAGFYLCYDIHCNHQQHVRKIDVSGKGYLKPCEKCGGTCFWK